VANKELYSKIARHKEYLKYFFEKYRPICCLCGGEMNHLSFFPQLSNKQRDEFAIHHIDHDHNNNSIDNQGISHRDCHKRLHREEQIALKKGKKEFSYSLYERKGNKIAKRKFTWVY